MRGARQIGRISGIPVRIHWSFLLVIGWSAHIGYRAGGSSAVLFSVALTLILFGCVFLHELGHALAARRFGVRTRSITLLPIGGVAALERIPEKPREELVIALAGPMVNVVIAAGLYAWIGWPEEFMQTGPVWNFSYLREMVLLMNLFMIGFNMIPAFPMDGGRVLRACLAWIFSYETATTIASAVGQVFAVLMVGYGLGSNPFLAVIGVMVFLGARVETRMVQLRSALTGLTVGGIMEPPRVVGPWEPLRSCLERWHEDGSADFLVLDGLRLDGVLPMERWQGALQDPRAGLTAADAMERPVMLVRPDMPVNQLCDIARSSRQAVFPVLQDGLVVGMVTRRSLLAIMASGGHGLRVLEARGDGPAVGRTVRGRSWLDVG